MKTKKEAANLLEDFLKTSSGIVDFSLRIFGFFEDNEDSDLFKAFERICLEVEGYGTKIVVPRGEGVYYYMNGKPLENEKIKMMDIVASKSAGAYISQFNILFLNTNVDDIENTKNTQYGIDQLMMDNNFMLVYAATYVHELFHALMFNQNLPSIPDSPEIMEIKNLISKSGKMNNLWYLNVIDAHWQEVIAHLVTNKRYYHWVKDNNKSFDLSKALNSIFSDEILRMDVITLINGFSEKFFHEQGEIVYAVPDYNKSKNFMSRDFFADNPGNILGIEQDTTNRFNKAVKKTKRHPGDNSLEDITDRVTNVPPLDWEAFDNYKKIDEFESSAEIEELNKSIEASIERKKKQIETGEKEELPDLISFTESVNLYNVMPGYLSWLEIEAYLFCYPGENKNLWREEFEYSDEEILASTSTITLNKLMDNECEITIPTVIYTGYHNEFFSIFLHGDVYSKTLEIKNNREDIIVERGEDYYNTLIQALDGVKFVEVSFDNEDYNKRPFISPVSETAKEFQLNKFLGSTDRYNPDSEISLLEAFVYVISSRELEWFKASRYKGVIQSDMMKALKGSRMVERPYRGRDLTSREKAANDDADNRDANKFDMVFEQTCICFSDFIRECVDEEFRKKLEEEISGFYNKFCFTELEKIPVGFTHSSRFKRSRFKLKNIQRNSIAYQLINKTALLAHEVGVGKTTSSLAIASNAMDTGRAHRILIVTPTPVYEKWINECINHTEKIIDPDTGEEEEIEFYGAFPHFNVVGLSNLNSKVLMDLKEYSAEEKKKIKNANAGYVKFKGEIKKLLKDIEDEEEPVDEDADEIVDASSDEDTPKRTKSKLPVVIPEGMVEIKALVNNLLKFVEIDALEGLGITNEENKTYDGIFTLLENSFENNTMSNMMKKLYTDAGEKLDKVRYFNNIYINVHASVILSYLLKAYASLESSLIAKLGTLKEFPTNTVFFTTYSGMERFGFKPDTISLMAEKFMGIIKGSDIEKSEEAKVQQNIESLLMKSELDAKIYFEDFGFDFICMDEAHRCKNLMITVTTKDDEDDYLGDTYKGNKKQIKTIRGSSQSKAALIGFMSTMFIQMKNGGRNTLLLTATPFTNSPLEIYSMLTLTNHSYLSSLGYSDVLSFAQDFIKIKSQLSISVEGTVRTKIEPVGYTNLSLLRRIIYTLVDFRSAEESNIMRPCKIVLPIREKSTLCDSRTSHGFSVIRPVSTIVIPSRQQQLIFDALQLYLSRQVSKRNVDDVFRNYIFGKGEEYIKKMTFAEEGLEYADYMESVDNLTEYITEVFNVDKNGKQVEKLFPAVAILKTLSAMRMVSISPYMFRPYVNGYLGIADDDIDTDQVVQQSTKLMYTLNSIKASNNIQLELGKELKGFVIYSNLGTKPGKNSPVSLLKILKAYMLDEKNGFGYKSAQHSHENFRKKFDDVEIIADESASNPKKRNALMDLFNRGQIKVIITTIKEGVDLNGNPIGLFNLSVDWNPTDAKQIEGRAWRQGNKNAYCIICYPLTANSSDMAIYQKLQDKTSRLKALWDKNSNLKSAFDLDEFNPEELKLEMISRVEKLAPFIFNEETTTKRFEYELLKAKKDEDTAVIRNFKTFQEQEPELRYAMQLFTKIPKVFEKENKLQELWTQIRQSQSSMELIKSSIQEAKEGLPEYAAFMEQQQKFTELQDSLKSLASEIGTAFAMDDNKKVEELKKDMDKVKKQIADEEKKVAKAEKALEAALADSIKESEKELKKEEKELQRLTKAKEVLQEEKPFEIPDVKLEYKLDDQIKGNYFVKSDTGSVIYKSFDKFKISLDKIDWVNKATIFDIFEGLTRLIEMYTNQNSQFSMAFSDWEDDNIELEDLNSVYPMIPREGIENLTDYMGTMSGRVNKYRFLQLVKDYYSSYNRRYWNLFWTSQMKVSILRSLRDYKSIVEDKDPDEYLAEFDEKLEKLYQEIGASDSLTDIPEETIEKYLNKAFDIVKARRIEFENYDSLVDGYISFADLFNIELESVFIDEKKTKELAEKATIEIAEEVPDKEKARAMIQAYEDKIEVYQEMIEENGINKKQKEKYQDKIDVYQEMIEDLKSDLS